MRTLLQKPIRFYKNVSTFTYIYFFLLIILGSGQLISIDRLRDVLLVDSFFIVIIVFALLNVIFDYFLRQGWVEIGQEYIQYHSWNRNIMIYFNQVTGYEYFRFGKGGKKRLGFIFDANKKRSTMYGELFGVLLGDKYDKVIPLTGIKPDDVDSICLFLEGMFI